MMRRWWRAARCLGAATVGLLLLSGCMGVLLPSQKHPSCSWGSEVPPHAGTLCTATVHTLQALAQASVRGDVRRIRHLAPAAGVASRIIATSRSWRAHGPLSLHVVPSITLSAARNGSIGAHFYLLGKNAQGPIQSENTVYLRVHAGNAVVVGDQPAEDW
jgi:hypothetical protein